LWEQAKCGHGVDVGAVRACSALVVGLVALLLGTQQHRDRAVTLELALLGTNRIVSGSRERMIIRLIGRSLILCDGSSADYCYEGDLF